MTVSIITICYNNEKDIRRTIESVVYQTYSQIEYIIVDGKSSDNSLQIINQYKRKISKVISEPDMNLYDAINKGIKLSTGDIVGLIHAGDQLYDNQVIQKVVDFHHCNEIDISYGDSQIINRKGEIIRINKSPRYSPRLVRRGWMPSHQSIYVKRSLFQVYGYYNIALHPAADYEWFIRYFYVNRPKIQHIDAFIIKFHTGGISTSNYMKRLGKESKERIKECWRINGIKAPGGIVYLKFIRKIKQYILGII